jgi:hypothetical protein
MDAIRERSHTSATALASATAEHRILAGQIVARSQRLAMRMTPTQISIV